MQLEHVNMTVSDLDRSISFYCAVFGARVRWRGQTTSGTKAAHVGDDKCYLAMFESAGKGPAVDDYESVGLNHFGFVVDDLDLARQRLAEQGAEPHQEADYEPGKRLYFHDPDGIEVELVQYEPSVVG